jgi:hypothetical protein
MFFPNVIDTLLNELKLNRFTTNNLGEKVLMNEMHMFETAKDDMPFWLFSKMTADRAGVYDFFLAESDIKTYFSSNSDSANKNRDWNVTFVNFVPESTKEVIIFNHFSNAINHIYVDKSFNEEN